MSKTMTGIERLGNRKLYHFSHVVALVFEEYPVKNGASYSVRLSMQADEEGKRVVATMLFLGVTELKLQSFGASITQITGLDVVDVSDRQLEGISFQVTDYEHGVIEFFCASAEIIRVETIADGQ